MRPAYFIYLTAVLPTMAVADIEPICEDLWFSRNAMLNDAGYCFATPLGRSLFDNSDCTTQSPALSPEVAQQISRIQALELQPPTQADGMCRVDTNQTRLDGVSHIDLRQRLTFQPSTDGSAGFCVGYQGSPLTLHAAPDETSDVLGQIPAGASISDAHLPWNDWNFAIVQPTPESGLPIMMGWYRGDVLADAGTTGASETCAAIAG